MLNKHFKDNTAFYLKRLLWVRFLMMLIVPLLGYRIFVVGVLGHESYSKQAKNQYYTQEEIPSSRGEIFAQTKDGLYPLAINAKKFQIWVVPKNVKDKQKVAQILSKELQKNELEIFDQINNNKLYIPPLAKRVEEGVASKIKGENLAGVLVVPENVRYYPEGELASHILGFVNFDDQGAYGVEGYYNDQLMGYKGALTAERDNKGRFINIDEETKARDGDNLILTIDHNIQYFAEEKIKAAVGKYGAESGQIIVLDPKTGKILAMAGTPSFNPNNFNEEAKRDKEEGKDRMTNPLISYVYEPGSIVKPIVVAKGLDMGKFEPDTEAGTFSNMVVVQGYEIHTAQDKPFGKETITQILEHSDNVGMVWVGEQIGKEAMYENFAKFGWGKVLGLDISGETTGFLLPLKKWRDIHQATMTFGQGISATPLQVVNAYSAIANNGELLLPHIVDKIVKPDGKEIQIEKKVIGQAVSRESAQKVQKMLQSVIENSYRKRTYIEGYSLAGKTGTAQVPKPGGGYEEKQSIHSFVGFGPVEDPRFVILVKLDKPSAVEFAEGSAGPVFREMADFLLRYMEIEPKK
ncbi:MAG: cell division protein FtsI (penicillin-binding protein 3) [Candidatus Berkelbacteria bacterium Licking1014_7]|uniref:Cell division protein FtsI (Penicillin-binding protein 3) n=1 Tax=Candidatus Berkelbacteria bacterium Licking1014_7 TaxID=2017147 RepID=A0A554LJL6_9BACT|nr:MAG: cell division protein FtsI (penicillin-binding protein 3) [Candidatus Berkelbacteria bacterium Licking1014_7]